jgi:hypothetical protein
MSETGPTTRTRIPDLPGPLGPVSFQVTWDCADPHAQARFWAAALGYALEEHEEFIRGLLHRDLIRDDETVIVDGVLHFATAAAIRPDGADQAEAMRSGNRLLFLKVPEPKTVKNRVHLDLKMGPGLREAEVERLASLGATVLTEHDSAEGRWTVMADPEGNEFCVNER